MQANRTVQIIRNTADEEDGKEEPVQDTEQLPEDGSADSDEKREMNDWTKILQIEILMAGLPVAQIHTHIPSIVNIVTKYKKMCRYEK